MRDTYDAAPARQAEPVSFEFRGKAGEWFGIWIVNLLLSIVTLGIYSAWAKVRTKKYFYNHTYVAGRNFDYHATGMQILIGRLIVVAAVVVFQLASSLDPIISLVLILALVVVFPWLIVRSMMFNARMSSFSNVRFNFLGGVGQAFLVFLIYPILTALTLYTTFPLLDRAVKRFSINNHRLGTAKFEMEAPIWPFYKAMLFAALWVLAVGVVAVALTGFQLANLFSLGDVEDDPVAIFTIIGLFYLMFFLAFLPAAFMYQAMTRNVVYNSTELSGGHRFHSNVTTLRLMWIAVSNAVIAAVTLGLMLPWTQVRLANYLANHTYLLPGGSLDDFVGRQVDEGMSVGEAYSDLEGIDVGLPI
ncbi:YjgN family protein [Litoreibacter roseus]|uniref:Membrane protein n=1 Tax=Litoreibacter roseus TaxID=2601869 RepID=A0A6N6JET2_9RHOB|nr:YjgN family protein [Litoreibacter roseus]GFE64736.1 membrane protein [Litoreibacter roseus]